MVSYLFHISTFFLVYQNFKPYSKIPFIITFPFSKVWHTKVHNLTLPFILLRLFLLQGICKQEHKLFQLLITAALTQHLVGVGSVGLGGAH